MRILEKEALRKHIVQNMRGEEVEKIARYNALVFLIDELREIYFSFDDHFYHEPYFSTKANRFFTSYDKLEYLDDYINNIILNDEQFRLFGDLETPYIECSFNNEDRIYDNVLDGNIKLSIYQVLINFSNIVPIININTIEYIVNRVLAHYNHYDKKYLYKTIAEKQSEQMKEWILGYINNNDITNPKNFIISRILNFTKINKLLELLTDEIILKVASIPKNGNIDFGLNVRGLVLDVENKRILTKNEVIDRIISKSIADSLNKNNLIKREKLERMIVVNISNILSSVNDNQKILDNFLAKIENKFNNDLTIPVYAKETVDCIHVSKTYYRKWVPKYLHCPSEDTIKKYLSICNVDDTEETKYITYNLGLFREFYYANNLSFSKAIKIYLSTVFKQINQDLFLTNVKLKQHFNKVSKGHIKKPAMRSISTFNSNNF